MLFPYYSTNTVHESKCLKTPLLTPFAAALVMQGDWTCDDCGNINFARRMECNKCQAPRTDGGGPKGKKGKGMGKGGKGGKGDRDFRGPAGCYASL